MRPVLRGVLVAAGVLVACLLALWLSLVAGTWMAVNAATGTVTVSRLVGLLVFAGGMGVLARAVMLLADDVRKPGRRR